MRRRPERHPEGEYGAPQASGDPRYAQSPVGWSLRDDVSHCQTCRLRREPLFVIERRQTVSTRHRKRCIKRRKAVHEASKEVDNHTRWLASHLFDTADTTAEVNYSFETPFEATDEVLTD